MYANIPLAERLRPNTLNDLVGQQHLTEQGSILRTAIEKGYIPSMILWGPPRVGKTTIARTIFLIPKLSFKKTAKKRAALF